MCNGGCHGCHRNNNPTIDSAPFGTSSPVDLTDPREGPNNNPTICDDPIDNATVRMLRDGERAAVISSLLKCWDKNPDLSFGELVSEVIGYDHPDEYLDSEFVKNFDAYNSGA